MNMCLPPHLGVARFFIILAFLSTRFNNYCDNTRHFGMPFDQLGFFLAQILW